jgi:hypothetical protein
MAYLKDMSTKPAAPDVIKRRREQFAGLNEIVTKSGGWLVSTPGNREVVVECLPQSDLPNLLADRGHDLKPEPDGERIMPTTGAIVRTRRFSFNSP